MNTRLHSLIIGLAIVAGVHSVVAQSSLGIVATDNQFVLFWRVMKKRIFSLRFILAIIIGFQLDLTLPALGTPNVIAFETIAAYARPDQFGETNVPPDLTNAIQIAAGGFFSLALKQDKTVVAWGDNRFGQINVPAGLSNVIAVAAGYYHGIALQAGGTITEWGDDAYGQTNVPAGLSNVVAISGSYYGSAVLKSDGTVLAWGANGYGQTNIPAGLSNIVAISAGLFDTTVLQRDGTVLAFGGGYPAIEATNIPAGLTKVVAINCAMTISAQHTLALRSDGTVASWGYADAGVPLGLSNVVAIAAGGSATDITNVARNLVLESNGTLFGWGGITNLPSNQSNIIAIASGEQHQLALIGSGLPLESSPIISPIWAETNFNAEIQTQCGHVYSLEFKNSLNDPCWTALPLVAGVGGIISLADLSATNSQRFYRVRRW